MSRRDGISHSLSPVQVRQIRAFVPDMLAEYSMNQICIMLERYYPTKHWTIKDAACGLGIYHDPDYTPPIYRARCNRCGVTKPIYKFYQRKDGGKNHLCKICNSKRYYRGVDSKPKRDPVESQQYQCRVCGMGVNMKGKAFQSQHDADQCCAGTVPIYRHSVLQTRGRFVTLSDYI